MNHAPTLMTILSMLWLIGQAVSAAEPSMKITVNRDKIYVGESVIVHVKISGARDPGEPDMMGFEGCTIKRLGGRDVSRRSIVIINGRSRIDSFTGFEFIYEVTPTAPGKFIFGPITSNAEGRRLTGRSPPIEVLDIEGQDIVIIEVASSRSEVLIDESFRVTMRVLIKRLSERFQNTDPMIPAAPPKLSAEYLAKSAASGLEGPVDELEKLLQSRIADRTQAGLLLNDYTVTASPLGLGSFFSDKEPAKFAFDRRVVERAGRSYFEYSIAVTYTARELGDYVFGPATLKGDIPVKVDSAGRAETQPIYAVGRAATVRVVPPPDEGRPDAYIGIIGSNITVDAKLDAQTCRVGDPLTLAVTVEGRAHFENATMLQLSKQPRLLDRFRVYEDTAQVNRTDESITYTFILRPQVDGTYELPPIDISYFDVSARKYQTVQTVPLPIRVNPSVQIQAADLIAAETNSVTSPHTQARTSGLMAPVTVSGTGAYTAPIARVPVLLGIAGFGPAAFLLCVSANQARRRLIRRSPIRRRRDARNAALRRLAGADPASSSRDARSALIQAIGEYVGAIAERPGASLASPDVERIIKTLQPAEQPVPGNLSSIFEQHYNDHFGGIEPATSLAEDIDTAKRCIEAYPMSAGRHLKANSLPVIILASLLVPGMCAGQESVHAFAWNQANNLLSSAETPDEYISAAVVYQRLIDGGVRNGPLFYNLGTALLGAQRYDDGIRHLLRAERYMGHHEDIKHNLALAIAKRDEDPEAGLPWYRVVLFWHYRLSLETRLVICALAFSVCWVAALLRFTGFMRWRYVLAGAIAAFAMFGYSAATDLYAESEADASSAAWLTPEPAQQVTP